MTDTPIYCAVCLQPRERWIHDITAPEDVRLSRAHSFAVRCPQCLPEPNILADPTCPECNGSGFVTAPCCESLDVHEHLSHMWAKPHDYDPGGKPLRIDK